MIWLLSALPVTGFPPQASASAVPNAFVQAASRLRLPRRRREASWAPRPGSRAVMLRFYPSTVGLEVAALGMEGTGQGRVSGP